MIRKKTVFIIGAGASVPYGYPTGMGLRERIINSAAHLKQAFPIDSLRYVTDNFIDAFRKSSTVSIDLFLSRNPEFIEVGKPIIVKLISDYEKKSQFREEVKREEDWYSFIFQEMSKEMSSKFDYEKFADNNVMFITFNYDRSLEQFLAESFVNSFRGIESKRLYEVLRKIQITHVYGQVAPLSWQDAENVIDYRGIDDSQMVKLSKNIHVIGEERRVINEALRSIDFNNVEKIFFLGFGFSEENLKILNVPGVFNSSHKVFGSGIGFLKEQVITLRSRFSGGIFKTDTGCIVGKSGRIDPAHVVIESNASCLSILKKYLFFEDYDYLSHVCREANGYQF